MNNKLLSLFFLISIISIKAQWVQVNGSYYAGPINCLAVSGTDIFEGTRNNGILISTDNGIGWKLINNGLPSLNVTALAVYPTKTAETYIIAGIYGCGVFLSTNNGANWTAANQGLDNSTNIVESIVVSDSNIFASISGRIYFSKGVGQSWTMISSGISEYVNLVAEIKTEMGELILFAGTSTQFGTDGHIFISTNNGKIWTKVDPGIVNSRVLSFALLEDGTDHSNLFAGTISGGICHSTNYGTSWIAVDSGLTHLPNSMDKFYDISAFAVSGTNIFTGTYGSGVFLTTNNGKNWTAVNNGLSNRNISSLIFKGTNLFAGTDAGVFLSTNNGTTWTAANYGSLTDTYVLSLAINGTDIFAGTYRGGVFLSTNSGISWTAVNNGLPTNAVGVLEISPSSTNEVSIYAGTHNETWSQGGVFLSTNNGIIWNTLGLDSSIAITSLTVASNETMGTNIFAGSYNGGVYISKDYGENWKFNKVIKDYPEIGTTALIVIPKAADTGKINGVNIFAGTYGGGVYLSTDSGTNWVYKGLINWEINSFAIIVNDSNGINIFAGSYNGGVYISKDYGANWTQVDSGLVLQQNDPRVEPAYQVRDLVVSGTNLFAGLYGSGIFLSTNNGVNWRTVNTGLTNLNILTLATDGMNLFAGTYYGGVFKRPLSEILTNIKEQQDNLPTRFSLQQNYPNPFNPTTVIEYQLPKSGIVTLKVYDVLGREVKTLVNGYKTPGKYSVNFDASNLSSGIYFYRLQSGDFNSVKKMILMK